MSAYLRLLILLIVLGAVAALVVWLIHSFLALYLSVQNQPILGTALIAAFVVILLLFIIATVYYLFLFRKPAATPALAARPPEPQTVGEKLGAAQQNLTDLQIQMQQIQDEIAREALAAKSAALAKALAQPRLRVVIFGTGSAGKTSLVNALLGQRVGEVAATLGTTTTSALYRWQLPGIPEPVDILDSPGILEIGVPGAAREKEARDQAKLADLLIFVVDADLRQSEYEPLLALAQLGKRSLLVLNKTDRYTPSEQQILLARLRERIQGVIAYEDVLLAAAHPSPIPTAQGTLYPDPEVLAVRDRVQAILLAEGRTLLADNALLQSQELGDEARRIIAEQLQKQAEQIVERYQWIITGVVFANPIPALDLLAIAAINAQMVVELGSVYGCKMTLQQGKELALSLGKTLASMGLVEGAIQLTTGIITLVAEASVVGFWLTAPIQAASAGYLTRIAGRSFIQYFQKNQTWGEGGIQAVVQSQVKQTERVGWMTAFIQEAAGKVFKFKLPGSKN